MKKFIAFMSGLIFSVQGGSAAAEKVFPPVPKWKPSFSVTTEDLLKTMNYYTDGKKDLAIFTNGTLVVLPEGLSDQAAIAYALKTLNEIYTYHPDMNPKNMDDGNILIQYNKPAFNIVISKFANEHIKEIQANHLAGLATDEVLMTPLGANKFDEFGMKAIYGRTFMFMDAQTPKVIKIYRGKKAT
ncbi:MAG TPA: hypothetical protein PK129_11915 [Cellvibrionaceae bacterium]|nr:hypothetical protein [Cellvibrionaceae bacterium]